MLEPTEMRVKDKDRDGGSKLVEVQAAMGWEAQRVPMDGGVPLQG